MLRHVPSQGRSAGGRRPCGGRGRSRRGPRRGSACARGAGRRGARRHRPAGGRPRRTPARRRPPAASRASASSRRRRWPDEPRNSWAAMSPADGASGPDRITPSRRRASPGRSGSRRGRGSRASAAASICGHDIGHVDDRLAALVDDLGPSAKPTRTIARVPTQSGSMIGSLTFRAAPSPNRWGRQPATSAASRVGVATVDPPVWACNSIARRVHRAAYRSRRDVPGRPGHVEPHGAPRRADARRSRAGPVRLVAVRPRQHRLQLRGRVDGDRPVADLRRAVRRRTRPAHPGRGHRDQRRSQRPRLAVPRGAVRPGRPAAAVPVVLHGPDDRPELAHRAEPGGRRGDPVHDRQLRLPCGADLLRRDADRGEHPGHARVACPGSASASATSGRC